MEHRTEETTMAFPYSDPALSEATAAVDAARAEQRKVNALVREKVEVYEAVLNEFVSQHLADADLDDPEDMLILSELGWNHARGNAQIEDFINDWVRSKDPHLRMDGWIASSEDAYSYENMVPIVNVSVTCKLTEGEVANLVEGLRSVTAVMVQLKPDYYFDIFASDPGKAVSVRVTFNLEDGSLALNRHGYPIFHGAAEEGVRYIMRNYPYCSCTDCKERERELDGYAY